MKTSQAVVPTASAGRYMRQLSKHWSRKFETQDTETSSRIVLPRGEADLTAGETALTVRVTATQDDAIGAVRQVVQSHIESFAFRETLNFEWSED